MARAVSAKPQQISNVHVRREWLNSDELQRSFE